ncbi:hypothetical protein KQ876_00850 [Mycoplasma sp. CSL7491-lung]|uniref:hypothetical protein n=1 Tax=Mycoplasma sp. CSL7491-lung TaxID=549718 RepID=UPI001C10EBB2|nr:hypothetical protein [Mycoplasma sp. CSL7491-lung]MBU4692754.1 hypothetical protein [Mycoplasma sp. CSL7491-lung]
MNIDSDRILFSKYKKYLRNNFYISFGKFKDLCSVKVLNNAIFKVFNKSRKCLKNTIELFLKFFDNKNYSELFFVKKCWKPDIGFSTNRIYR